MAGPSGFVERIKGKIAQSVVWVGGRQLTTADQALASGWGTLESLTSTNADGSTVKAFGVTVVATTAAAFVNLPAPVAGAGKFIILEGTTASGSTAVICVGKSASTVQFIWGGSTGSGASTTTNIIKYTSTSVAWTIFELVGRSTSQWYFTGVYPSTIGHLQFSTSS